jgi:glycerophosphoryl diester phosphodiesterase
MKLLRPLRVTWAVVVLSISTTNLAGKEPGLLFAHRGGAHEFEENTLPAFQASYEKGLRGFETDVRMTRDGQFVILHDDLLDRTYDASGTVEEKTAAELKNVKSKRGDQTLLFLDDLLDYFADKPGVYFELEMKTGNKDLYPDDRIKEYCQRLRQVVKERQPEGSTYVLTSFDKRPLQIIHESDPDADLLYIINDGACTADDVKQAQALGARRMGVRIDKVTRNEIAAAQAQGMLVNGWPGHSLVDYHLAVGLGVDAICCDVPVAVQAWKDKHEQ